MIVRIQRKWAAHIYPLYDWLSQSEMMMLFEVGNFRKGSRGFEGNNLYEPRYIPKIGYLVIF
jgi:hypothetical protein